jgi:hypothetical protein
MPVPLLRLRFIGLGIGTPVRDLEEELQTNPPPNHSGRSLIGVPIRGRAELE